ncbi:ricin-type beta-trefoil lectin domain protein [Nonomuraea sp. NPDC050022]|uniref:ricin-type beta-trefoil lectin domain protein n=1 Tax=Nonomuraea sp. NPDC050022 TaxID=3364358 RepID=UPI003792DC22
MVAPPPGSVFYIASRIQPNTSVQPYVLAIEGDATAPGAPIILYPQETSQSQLWTMTADGHIISQLNACAITWDETQSLLVTQQEGDPSYPCQLWTITDDGYIENQSVNGEVLSAPDRYGWGRGTLALASPSGADPWGQQHWTLLASTAPPVTIMKPRWVYFQSALQDADGNTCVLNVKGGSTTPGAQVIVWPLGTGVGNNELWQVTQDGRILSRQGGGLILALGSPFDGGGNYTDVDAYPDGMTGYWDLYTPNEIRNASSANCLVPSGMTGGPGVLTDGDPVLAAPGTSSAAYTWYAVPSAPLDAVLTQPLVPFLEFTGEEAQAYTAICQGLGVTSLRAEYCNLDRTLSDYGYQIATWTQPPEGISQDSWDAVRHQLTTEIQYADATRDLFANYQEFQLALFTNNDQLTQELISDAGISEGTNEPIVGGVILAVFEGLLYTGLSAAGDGFAVAANLMEMGVSVALAASSDGSGSISPDPFQVTVSELWNELNKNYTAVLSSMGDMELAILQDWGKMQSVFQLTEKPSGGDSLYWGPTTTADAVKAATPGYKASVMQMLLPSKYQIYTSSNGYHPSDIPGYAQWYDSQGVLYWIAAIGNPQEYPGSQAMQQDVWDNGVRQSDFFLSAAGWAFPMTTDQVDWFGSYGYSRFTFTNQTPDDVQVQGNCVSVQRPPYTFTVGPYQSSWVDMAPGVYRVTAGDLENTLLRGDFQLSVQCTSVYYPPKIWISEQSSTSGCALTPALCNQGLGWYQGVHAGAYAGGSAQIGLVKT